MYKTLRGHSSDIHAIHLTPDGKWAISGSGDSTCILWNLDTGKAIQTLKGHTNTIFAVYITPDGKNAISGSIDKTCILWDLAKGEAIKILKGHTDWVMAVCISPDGQRAISASLNGECFVWDLTSWEVVKILKGHTRSVNSVSFTPNGKLAITGSTDNTCILWNLKNGEKKGIYIATSAVNAVSCFPGGIFGGESSSKTFILNLNKELVCPDKAIITIRSIWSFKKHIHMPLSADCPLCGLRFDPPASVLTTIEDISIKAGLKSGESPCMELPREVWQEPGLLSNCPKCGGEIKFNPFIAGNDKPKTIWKFWQNFNQ